MRRSKSAWLLKSEDAAPSPIHRTHPAHDLGELGSSPPPLTILRELRGAHESGDLEGVPADGAAAEALQAPARGRVALLLQLRLRGRQAQVRGRVFQLLRFGLWVQLCDVSTPSHSHETRDAVPALSLTL